MALLYPLKFKNDFHTTLWGGRRLKQFKGIISQGEVVGESWEISVVPNYVSRIANGELTGKLLTDVINENPDAILGESVVSRFGAEFPLLIKFIDAEKNLSIQVHPDDNLAMQRYGCKGKTEMWYILDAREDTQIISGLTDTLTSQELETKINNLTIEDSLAHHNAKRGDVFFIPAGRIHAIGQGTFVLEVQENSNITYRLYDYDRIDINGRKRELHIQEAKEAIDYKVYDSYKEKINYNSDYTPIADCDFFKVSQIGFEPNESRHFEISAEKRFKIYVCIEGRVAITDNNGTKTLLKQGETTLIPAALDFIEITPRAKSTLIEITV